MSMAQPNAIRPNKPEITLRAIIISIILTIALTASNAYLGLKVGTTISASIPAAIIAMGVLRLLGNNNILENNIVQTAASAGQALIIGIAYVMPALIILQLWNNFHYWETALIASIGGFLGVLFSIPLRRVLLTDKHLTFPEGVAIGNVLNASITDRTAVKYLVQGSIAGSLLSLAQSGFKLIAESISVWFESKDIVWGIGFGFSPTLMAAGYIIGIRTGLSIIVGIIIGWLIGIPILSHISGAGLGENPANVAIKLWHDQIRYIGIGVMLLGGTWTLINLVRPIYDGVSSSFASVQHLNCYHHSAFPHTERDIPIRYVLWSIVLLIIPMSLLLNHILNNQILLQSPQQIIFLIGITILFILLMGFIFSSICSYFAGLVGTTNSPLSAVMLACVMLISLLLICLLQTQQVQLSNSLNQNDVIATFAIIITAIITSATSIANETMQDFKAGQMVGATPWKQQLMLLFGVLVAALVIPLILQVLFNAYGISGIFPRPGMNPEQMLAAPQAGTLAIIIQGVFTHHLPWSMLNTGFIIAVIALMIDHRLQLKSNHRLHILGIGLGIYLPIDTTITLSLGAIISYLVDRKINKLEQQTSSIKNTLAHYSKQNGLLLACGLVAGATLMGVVLAIPFAIAKSTDVLRLVSADFQLFAQLLAIISSIILGIWLYRIPLKNT